MLHFPWIFRSFFVHMSWILSSFWLTSMIFSYILIWPVDKALVSHSRSLTLNGSRTRLTPRATSTALSGYRKWCVVRFPTSFSNPRVTALFILWRRKNIWWRGSWEETQTCMRSLLLYIFTGSQSCGSWSGHHVQTVAGCPSCQLLHSYGKVMGGASSPQWVEKWPGTFLTSLPLDSGHFQTAEDPVDKWSHNYLL